MVVQCVQSTLCPQPVACFIKQLLPVLTPTHTRTHTHTVRIPHHPFLQTTDDEDEKPNSPPVPQKPHPLRRLAPEIDEVAREQQVVLRRHGHGVAHEGRRVERQRGGHAAGDAVFPFDVSRRNWLSRRYDVGGWGSQRFRGGSGKLGKVCWLLRKVEESAGKRERSVQFRIFLDIRYSGGGDAEIGSGTPEICGRGSMVAFTEWHCEGGGEKER